MASPAKLATIMRGRVCSSSVVAPRIALRMPDASDRSQLGARCPEPAPPTQARSRADHPMPSPWRTRYRAPNLWQNPRPARPSPSERELDGSESCERTQDGARQRDRLHGPRPVQCRRRQARQGTRANSRSSTHGHRRLAQHHRPNPYIWFEGHGSYMQPIPQKKFRGERVIDAAFRKWGRSSFARGLATTTVVVAGRGGPLRLRGCARARHPSLRRAACRAPRPGRSRRTGGRAGGLPPGEGRSERADRAPCAR